MIASYVSLFEDLFSLELEKQNGNKMERTCDVHVCLASTVLQGEEMLAFRFLDLSDKLTEKFREKIHSFLVDYGKTWMSGGRIVYPYQGDSKPAEHEVEYLRSDAESYQFIKKQIQPIQAYQDLLAFQDDDKLFINNLRFYVIVVKPLSKPQDMIYFYRLYNRKQLLSQSRFFGAIFRGTNEYDLIEEPTLLFDDTIDCISCGDDLFILKKDNFHSIFRFLEEVEKAVNIALTSIQTQLTQGKIPIEGYDNFATDCRKNRVKMTMLNNIAKRAYLKYLTPAKIKLVIDRLGKDVVGDEFITTFEKEQKLLYDAKRPWILLKLLNDSYLWSDMTLLGYDVNEKREL
ncbi:MAG: hypothetical protein NVS4B12_26510 [Ktedonobacteraceae bacterium]